MKKNNYFVRRFIAACITSVAILAGCAGFTEDGNSFSGASDEGLSFDIAQHFAAARVTREGNADIDEAKDSVTFVLNIFGGCFKRNGLFVYDSYYSFADEYHFAYKFRNDTLLLSSYYEDPSTKEIDTGIWVGGTSGKLDGTWLLTQCMYVNDEYGCGNEGYNKFFKLDGDKVEYRVEDRPDYDYMHSYFVNELFEFLGNQSTIGLRDVFYGSRYVDENAKKYGIVVQEKTNKSMKFTYDNHVFDLKLNYARYRDSVSVSLSSGETTCVGNHSIKHDVPPELCRDENALYLQSSRSDSESDALQYEKSNYREFQDCIDGILGRERTN